MPVIQVSENHGRKLAELLKISGKGGGRIAEVQQGYLETKNLDTGRKISHFYLFLYVISQAVNCNE